MRIDTAGAFSERSGDVHLLVPFSKAAAAECVHYVTTEVDDERLWRIYLVPLDLFTVTGISKILEGLKTTSGVRVFVLWNRPEPGPALPSKGWDNLSLTYLCPLESADYSVCYHFSQVMRDFGHPSVEADEGFSAMAAWEADPVGFALKDALVKGRKRCTANSYWKPAFNLVDQWELSKKSLGFFSDGLVPGAKSLLEDLPRHGSGSDGSATPADLFKHRRIISTQRSAAARTQGPYLHIVPVRKPVSREMAEAFVKDYHFENRRDLWDAVLVETNAKTRFKVRTRTRRLHSSALSAVSAGFIGQRAVELAREWVSAHQARLFPGFRVEVDTDHFLLMRFSLLPEGPEAYAQDFHGNHMIDFVVAGLLSGNRPVASWRTNLFAAFAAPEGVEPSGEAVQDEIENPLGSAGWKADALYFLPELRRRLLPTKGDCPRQALRSWRWDSLPEGLRLAVECENYPTPLVAEVEAVRLWRQADILLLEIEIAERGERLQAGPSERGIFWQDIAAGAVSEAPSFAQILDFNAEARLGVHLYPRETNRLDEGRRLVRRPINVELQWGKDNFQKISLAEGGPADEATAAPLLKHLLGRFFDEETVKVMEPARRLSDDRLRVMSSVLLEGPVPRGMTTEEEHDSLLSRLCQVDPYGTGWVYDAAFDRSEFDKSCYRRFWSFGSRFLASEHSFVYAAYRGEDQLVTGRQGCEEIVAGFSERFIHGEHMPRLYRRMFMHFLAMEATLRLISQELTALEDNLPRDLDRISENETESIRDLRDRMVLASSHLRQLSLSTQMQGREMTEWFESRFRLDAAFVALDEKISTLEAVLDTHHQRHVGRLLNLVAYCGLPLMIVPILWPVWPHKKDLPFVLFGEHGLLFGLAAPAERFASLSLRSPLVAFAIILVLSILTTVVLVKSLPSILSVTGRLRRRVKRRGGRHRRS